LTGKAPYRFESGSLQRRVKGELDSAAQRPSPPVRARPVATPRIERVAVLFNPATAPMRTIEDAAPILAVAARAAPVGDDAEIEATMTD